MNKKAVKKGILPYIFLFLVMLGILYFFNVANQKVNVIDYQQFLTAVSENKVKEITIIPNSNYMKLKVQWKGIMKMSILLLRCHLLKK